MLHSPRPLSTAVVAVRRYTPDMVTRRWIGQMAIVTGASSGIGAAIAEELSAGGASLVLTGRNAEALGEIAARCRAAGSQVSTVAGDLTEEAVRRRVVEAALDEGGVNLLVNNAGLSMNARFTELAPDVVRRIMEINFFAAVDLTRMALKSLVEHHGRIVIMSSITGLVGTPTRTAYSASKHALHGFFQALRVELRDAGVGVTIVCPGYVATPIRERALVADGSEQGHDQAVGRRMLTPDEVAQRTLNAAWKRKRLLKLGRETKLARFLSLVAPGKLEAILDRATR